MARALNRLTVRQVSTLKDPGRHADGGGLYLRVTPQGSRSWVFMSSVGGTRSEIGLGAAKSLPLARAREIAATMREAVVVGSDPRAVLSPPEPAALPQTPTFGEFAEAYITSVEKGWKNPVHRQQWRHSLRDHASRLMAESIDAIDTDMVLEVLQPIWLTKAETAGRVRGRIEKILDAAKARGLRPRDSMNPAALRGHLAVLLPRQGGMVRGHHKALHFADVPVFMVELRERTALAARCLEFTILTAARSGEALGAVWDEIDLEQALWTVPAARMKAGAEHVVPLAPAAIALLESLRGSGQPTERVFTLQGAIRSNMAMTMLLRRMHVGNATVHGFRSSFRDWAGDTTSYPRELVEQALAHTISSKTERAYRRGTAIERRRDLMIAWSDYIGGAL
ncbi:tyrosine-type recombinase/integrase [Sphingomonas sp.]|uniref:tyrosine-type recombinase/integrase n=1 Tax=Sphingomonas sp. TaxID=28214 RepID=UPI003B0054C9